MTGKNDGQLPGYTREGVLAQVKNSRVAILNALELVTRTDMVYPEREWLLRLDGELLDAVRVLERDLLFMRRDELKDELATVQAQIEEIEGVPEKWDA